MQNNELLAGTTVSATTGSNVAVTLATLLGTSRRQNGVDVIVYAPSGNGAVIRLVADGDDTAGVVLAADSTIVLSNHIVSDTALYVRGTTGDEVEIAVYAADNPSSWG